MPPRRGAPYVHKRARGSRGASRDGAHLFSADVGLYKAGMRTRRDFLARLMGTGAASAPPHDGHPSPPHSHMAGFAASMRPPPQDGHPMPPHSHMSALATSMSGVAVAWRVERPPRHAGHPAPPQRHCFAGALKADAMVRSERVRALEKPTMFFLRGEQTRASVGAQRRGVCNRTRDPRLQCKLKWLSPRRFPSLRPRPRAR